MFLSALMIALHSQPIRLFDKQANAINAHLDANSHYICSWWEMISQTSSSFRSWIHCNSLSWEERAEERELSGVDKQEVTASSATGSSVSERSPPNVSLSGLFWEHHPWWSARLSLLPPGPRPTHSARTRTSPMSMTHAGIGGAFIVVKERQNSNSLWNSSEITGEMRGDAYVKPGSVASGVSVWHVREQWTIHTSRPWLNENLL